MIWIVAVAVAHVMASSYFLMWLEADIEQLRQRLYQRGGHDVGHSHITFVLDQQPTIWSAAIALLIPLFGVWVVRSRWRTLRDATIDRLNLNQLIPGDTAFALEIRDINRRDH
jgi:hypothetical protein